MNRIEILLTDDEYADFLDLLEHCIFSESPSINSYIAELILSKIEKE